MEKIKKGKIRQLGDLEWKIRSPVSCLGLEEGLKSCHLKEWRTALNLQLILKN